MDILCRTCLIQLSDGGGVETSKYDIFQTNNLLKQLSVVTSLQVDSNDGFPRCVCHVCYKKIKEFHEFLEMSTESTQKLQEMINIMQKSVEYLEEDEHLIKHMNILETKLDFSSETEVNNDQYTSFETSNDSTFLNKESKNYLKSPPVGWMDQDDEACVELEMLTDEVVVEEQSEPLQRKSSKVGKRKRSWNPDKWKCNIRKQLRESAQPYISATNKLIPGRQIKEPCGEECSLKCSSAFSDDERNAIFKDFWSLSDNEKTSYYLKYVTRATPHRRRAKNSTKKQNTFSYYFPRDENTTTRVCRIFFINTLSITESRVYYCFQNFDNTDIPTARKGKFIKRFTPENKLSEVRQHISSFPSVHATNDCLNNSKQIVLDGNLNTHKMYILYAAQYEKPVGIHIYRRIFRTEFNIIFDTKPKKENNKRCFKNTF